jgi:hypothetical protein
MEAGRRRRLTRLAAALDRLTPEQIDRLGQAAGLTIAAVSDPSG